MSPITSLVKIALLSSKTKEGPDYSGTFVFNFFFLAAHHGLSRIKPLSPVVNPWTIREVPVINLKKFFKDEKPGDQDAKVRWITITSKARLGSHPPPLKYT